MQLFHGDCLDILPTLPDKSVDAIITDPPYGTTTNNTTTCKWDSVIPFKPMWKQLKRIIKPRGAIVLFGSQPFTSALIMSNVQMFKYCWVWNKRKAGNIFAAKRQPMRTYEDIIIFSEQTHAYYPQMVSLDRARKSKNYGTGYALRGNRKKEDRIYEYTHTYPTAIIDISNANQKGKLHPTQKPLPLLEYLVKTYTNEHDTVLDFTFGSGTTGVACANLDRDFIGIERDETYFNLASDRINKALATPRQLSILDT